MVEVVAAEKVEAKVVNESSNGTADLMALGSLILGIINLCSWCIPFCGCPMSIIGLVLGFLGLKSKKNAMFAKVGIVLSGLGLLASIVNGIAGVVLNTSTFSF